MKPGFGPFALCIAALVFALPVAVDVVAAPPAAASGPTITGGGSSYDAIAIDQWVAEVQQLYGINVNYSTSSAVIGLNEFAQNQVDFGASEIGYSTGQADYTPPAGEAYQYMPDVAGATCIMYNLPGPEGQITQLDLNPATLLGIFTGTITQWNDPAIAALNPGVSLPDDPIIVVYRSDASGENYILSDYFSVLEPTQWNAYTTALDAPGGAQAIWPTPPDGGNIAPYDFTDWVSQSGSDNASDYVDSSPYTVTYVETGYALEHHRPCASVENASGNFVQPSSLADAIALESDHLAPDLEQDLTDVFTTSQSQAYSISAYSYLITQESTVPAAKGAVLGEFIKFLACQGQQVAGQLGYSPLPPNLVQDDFDAISRINGAANPGVVDAQNCPNPYVDGTTPLPGEPVVEAPGGAGTGPGGTPGGTAATAGSNTSASGGAGGGAGGATPAAASPVERRRIANAREHETLAHELAPGELLSAVQQVGTGSSSSIGWWTLAVLVVLVVPPGAVFLRRRAIAKSAAKSVRSET